MLKKIIIIAVLLISMQIMPVSAYQFEDYELKSSKQEIIKILKNKKINFIHNEDPNSIAYDDEIFNRHCIVFFKFTPRSNMLSSVSIHWGSDVGNDVLALLIEKYGNPAYQNDRIITKEYAWDNGEKAILLNYDKFKTLLSYGEKEAQKNGLKEQQEINRKEIERF